jgi:hypothetical protein
MARVILDDRLPDHPKFARVGPLAGWLYICGLAYCNRLLTDGHIPAAAVRRLADVDDPDALAALLVRERLWEPDGDGFRVHDYLDYQQSRTQSESTSAARSRAGRKGGKQKASNLLEVCLPFASSKTQANGKQPPSPAPPLAPPPLPHTPVNTSINSAPAPARAREEPPADPDADEAAAIAAVPDEAAWPLVDAMLTALEERGKVAAHWEPSAGWRRTNLAIARELYHRGLTEEDVGGCTRMLLDDAYWGARRIDLRPVRSEMDRYLTNLADDLSPSERSALKYGFHPSADR